MRPDDHSNWIFLVLLFLFWSLIGVRKHTKGKCMQVLHSSRIIDGPFWSVKIGLRKTADEFACRSERCSRLEKMGFIVET